MTTVNEKPYMRRQRVLLVIDGMPERGKTRAALFTSAGYAVVTAVTGEDGLTLTVAHRPDLVLLATVLPDDGLAVCQRIKADPALSSCHILMLSADAASPEQRIAGLDQSRLQSEVDSMRESQQKESKQFEEREGDLLRRIRVLETEETRLRSQLEATDMESGRKIELMETIRRREQDLALERRTREQDREQFQTTQQALLRRIEELERTDGGVSLSRTEIPDPSAAAKSNRLARIGSWLKR